MPKPLLVGFLDLSDIREERVTPDRIESVRTALEQAIAQHETDMSATTALFVRDNLITDPQRKFESPVAARSQPLGEQGRALPQKQAGFYKLGFPIYDSGIAWGANYITRKKATVQKVNDQVTLMFDGDFRWNRDSIVGRLLCKEEYVFDDEEADDVIVKPLANGDATRYNIRAGANAGEQANHYKGFVDDISDAHNPFPVLHKLLKRRPENKDARILHLISENLQEGVENLAAFHDVDRDPDIRPSDNEEQLVGRFDVDVPGEILGKANKGWIAVWPALPDDYGITLAVDPSGEPVLAYREEEEEDLRGFGVVEERRDYPFWERQYNRRRGYGIWNRVAAAAWRIGNANYATPAGYEHPMW